MRAKTSILCVYNSRAILDEMLLSSLGKQTMTGTELILLDNTKARYSSVAQAYNSALTSVSGDVILAVHQDVQFYDRNALQMLHDLLVRISPRTLVGVLGASLEARGLARTKRTIYAGEGYLEDFRRVDHTYTSIPHHVQTLDECFLAARRDSFPDQAFVDLPECRWDHYIGLTCHRLHGMGFTSMVVPLGVNHAPTRKYAFSLNSTSPSLCNNYGPALLERMSTCYLATSIIERYLTSDSVDQRLSHRISTCSIRYPIPSPQLTLFRYGLKALNRVCRISPRIRAYVGGRIRSQAIDRLASRELLTID